MVWRQRQLRASFAQWRLCTEWLGWLGFIRQPRQMLSAEALVEDLWLGWLRLLCRAWRCLVGRRRRHLAHGLGTWHWRARLKRARPMAEVLSRVVVPGR